MLFKNKKIAIIGGGPVGLTLAKLLQQKGVDVTVYERDKSPEARIWGGTLDLHQDSGQLAMKEAGLLDGYFSTAIPMGINVTDEQGNTLFSKVVTTENQYDNPEINRNDLRKLLLDSLAPGTVVWDRKLTTLQSDNGSWVLQFEGHPDELTNVVIGANGGLSKIRSLISDVDVEDTGTFIIQGDVPQPMINCREFYEWCDGKRIMTANGGSLVVANPYNSGALTYGVIFKTPSEWHDHVGIDFQNTKDVAEYLSRRLSGWDKRYHQLFRSTTFFVGLPTRRWPLEKPWKRDRPAPVTLIGDAAHLMPPFAGKGVNTGLMDALLLSTNLTSGHFETIDAAIRDYERRMFAYAKEAQTESSENEIRMRHPDFSFQELITNR